MGPGTPGEGNLGVGLGAPGGVGKEGVRESFSLSFFSPVPTFPESQPLMGLSDVHETQAISCGCQSQFC